MAEHTSDSTVVNAGVQRVLDVIVDIDAYNQWAHGLNRVVVEERYDDGRPKVAAFTIEVGPVKDTVVVQYYWPEGTASPHIVSWDLLKASKVTEMSGRYVLTEVDADSTNVGYELTIKVKIPGFSLMRKTAERQLIDVALRDLKARVESLGSA